MKPGRYLSLCTVLAITLTQCDTGEPPEIIGVIEGLLVSENSFTVGDWPGATASDFVVQPWRDSEVGDEDICGAPQFPDDSEWQCSLGPRTGLFSVIDDRVPSPGLSPLRILVRVSNLGDEVEAYVSPIGHFIAEYALYLHENEGQPLSSAIDEARQRFAPFLFDATYPHTSPLQPDARVATNAERQAFLLTGLTRVAARHYGALPTFHKTRTVTATLGVSLRQYGEFRDRVVRTGGGTIVVGREFLRHDLALEVIQMAGEFDLSSSETRVLADQINGQSGRLFGFTQAPALPR